MHNTLYLANGKKFEGKNIGADVRAEGEVVFTTAMTGYLETMTDPSYYGQIVVFTAPLIGNYGVFKKSPINPLHQGKNSALPIDATYESEKIWVRGVILTEAAKTFSHAQAFESFCDWCKAGGIPVLTDIDTREITQILREEGCIMGTVSDKTPEKFEDTLKGRYVPEVSPKKVEITEPENFTKTVAFIDCGAKNGILRNFLKRGIRLVRFPFDADIFVWSSENNIAFDGVFCSNGPGDPETVTETIETVKKVLEVDLPFFGICLGNQILALAAGGKTKKMQYGHRGINQPCQEIKTQKCIVTSQNHGYEVDDKNLPEHFEVWFRNLNDHSVEGIRHQKRPVFSVQFHPEACAGPEDAEYLFDKFISDLKVHTNLSS
jgi:carbamoyl-phosphate synthase small subunit